jgi:hypothetical protein
MPGAIFTGRAAPEKSPAFAGLFSFRSVLTTNPDNRNRFRALTGP